MNTQDKGRNRNLISLEEKLKRRCNYTELDEWKNISDNMQTCNILDPKLSFNAD